jgi:hypothetical protein
VRKLGRTVPTFRAALEDAIKRWDGYRKALRRDEREAFDRMLDSCRLHASAGGHAVRPDPLEAMFMSILLEHQRRLDSLEAKMSEVLKELRRK